MRHSYYWAGVAVGIFAVNFVNNNLPDTLTSRHWYGLSGGLAVLGVVIMFVSIFREVFGNPENR